MTNKKLDNSLERIYNIKNKLINSDIIGDESTVEEVEDKDFIEEIPTEEVNADIENSIVWDVTPDMNFPTDTFEDNREFSLAEVQNYINTRLELLEDAQEEVYIDPETYQLVSKPVAERKAELERMKVEIEQMIAKAEAEEPGSSEPPEMEESA